MMPPPPPDEPDAGVSTADRYRRAAEVFLAACDLSGARRRELVDQACAGDDALRAEVESLLANHDSGKAFLEAPVEAGRASGQIEFKALDRGADGGESPCGGRGGGAPARIGRYRILGVLGEGGMGIVYRAEQESPRRVVALKVIRSGMAKGAALRRFEHEAEILARLRHPGIAQIYESGTADSGQGTQPYFAMELVEGHPLSEHAAGLDVRAKLELFIRVCDAVQHAHQLGIVHRDLKPGNILVQEGGQGDGGAGPLRSPQARGAGQPKILDFGVARLMDPALLATTLRTGEGQLLGTIPYMSPEQALGNADTVDTRSDVYSLGVILYELLAGRLPYDPAPASIPEMLRAISEREAVPLGSVNREFRGDLATIVGKALEKDAARRYQSASELRNDVHRFLTDQPIVARPLSSGYQLRKFARRNRGLVWGAAGTAAALVLGVIATGWAALVAQERLQRAESEAAMRARVQEFLDEMLASADPEVRGRRDESVRDMLDRASSLIQAELGRRGDNEVEAAIHETIGRTYRRLRCYEKSGEHLRRALELRREIHGAGPHADLATSMHELGMLLKDIGDDADAEVQLRNALAMLEQVQGRRHPAVARVLSDLGMLRYSNHQHEEATALLERALAVYRATIGVESRQYAAVLGNLGLLHEATGDPAGAEGRMKEALDVNVRLLGKNHPVSARTKHNLARVLAATGRLAEARAFFEEAVAGLAGAYGPEDADVGECLIGLGTALRNLGEAASAESTLSRSVAVLRSAVGDRDFSTARAKDELALVLNDRGQYRQAESLLEEALEVFREQPGERMVGLVKVLEHLGGVRSSLGEHEDAESAIREAIKLREEHETEGEDGLATSLVILGRVLLSKGDPASAEPELRRCLEIRRRILAPEHWAIPNTQSLLGTCLAAMGRFEEGEGNVTEGYEGLKKSLGSENPRTLGALRRVIGLYEAWDRPEKAKEYESKAPAGAR